MVDLDLVFFNKNIVFVQLPYYVKHKFAEDETYNKSYHNYYLSYDPTLDFYKIKQHRFFTMRNLPST